MWSTTSGALAPSRFFSLAEFNAAIGGIVADLNARIMCKLGVSRGGVAGVDRAVRAGGAAEDDLSVAEWKKCPVPPDYHVEVNRHYSVRSRLIREVVVARITDRTVEFFHNGSREPCALAPE